MYNLIYGELPTTSEYCSGQIAWRFKEMMEIEQIMYEDIAPEEKLAKALNKFYGCVPTDIEESLDYFLWFFFCGKDNKKSDNKQGANQLSRRAYDFYIDAPYIYAAFREQYGINLIEEVDLHWWEFMAMFECLNENTKMSRIIYYRTADTKGLPDKQRKFINKMRAMYEIKKPESNLSNEVKLAKRNADMKAYVERRLKECLKKE